MVDSWVALMADERGYPKVRTRVGGMAGHWELSTVSLKAVPMVESWAGKWEILKADYSVVD